MSKARSTALVAALLCAACTKTPQSPRPAPEPIKTAAPIAPIAPPVPEEKEAPPETTPLRPFSVPKSNWSELGNALSIASRSSRALPLVHLRFAVLAGSAVDGERTGLARVCATASARALQSALEPIGATVSTDIGPDRVVFRVSVLASSWPEALKRASAMLQKPAPPEKAFHAAQEELAERATRLAWQNGAFGARMVLAQDLFLLPSEHHPYASYDAQGEEIRKIKPSDCKDYYRRYFTPSSTLIAAAGDLRHEELKKAVESALGSWRGKPAEIASPTDPLPPESSKITLIDMPTQKQPEIVVGTLGPKREEPGFAPFLIATEILGGNGRGRLFQALQAKKDLATEALSTLIPYANGPSLYYSYARTTEAALGETLQSLLDALERLAKEAPTEAEAEGAVAALREQYALENAQPGHAADELCELWLQKNPDDAPMELLRKLSDPTPVAVTKAFSEHVRPGHSVIVVVADAQTVGPKLQTFGEVKVVNPRDRFSRSHTLPESRSP